MIKGEPGITAMMLKSGMEVEEDCTIFYYAPPIPDKGTELKYVTISERTRLKTAPLFVIPGYLKGQSKIYHLMDALIMENLDTSLFNPVYRDHGNISGTIVYIYIKLRASIIFGNREYSLGGPGPPIAL